MILQELVSYYERMAADPDSGIAPIGLEWKEIDFAIVIDWGGNFLDIEDLRSGDKKPRGRRCLVPQTVKRTVDIEPQLLWDNIGYVLGFDADNPSRAAKEHSAFKTRVKEIVEDSTDDRAVAAVDKFLSSDHMEAIKRHSLWKEIANSTGYISFRIKEQQRLVPEGHSVHSVAQMQQSSRDHEEITCLVTGEKDRLANLHPSIKGVYGGQASGGSIVSFNRDAFCSFGKEQGANAPVGTYAATAYTTALNRLLDRGSRQRLQLGETSVVFWSDKGHQLEGVLYDLFGEVSKDNPAAHTEAVKSLYKAPETGAMPFLGDDTRFFVLGLGPNAARICVRFWHASTVGDIAKNIWQYFSDIEIVRPSWAKEPPRLMSLLRSTALREERDNILPALPAAVLKSILDGGPFPQSLAMAVLRRVRAGDEINHHRAALLKAFLNRERRRYHTKEGEMTVALDETNKSVGYNLGRLFAVLEKIQGEALGDVNTSIREKYYPAASATPVTCFPLLMRLKNHHLAKLENKGRAVNLEKLLTNVVANVQDFPAHLSLADQGRFAIGYYHQCQAFYEKRDQHNQEAVK